MSDTNWAVQSQKMVRDLKFQIKMVEGFHYLCSENKGADQLCGYRTADLHLCFAYSKGRFLMTLIILLSRQIITKVLISMCMYSWGQLFKASLA